MGRLRLTPREGPTKLDLTKAIGDQAQRNQALNGIVDNLLHETQTLQAEVATLGSICLLGHVRALLWLTRPFIRWRLNMADANAEVRRIAQRLADQHNALIERSMERSRREEAASAPKAEEAPE